MRLHPDSKTLSDKSSAPPVGQRLPEDGWGDLLKGRHLVVAAVLCSGVLLYSMNLFFTAALMPTIVEAIGGYDYYAWVTTAFVVVAIVSTLLVSPMMDRRGPAFTYVAAFLLFGLGTLTSATSSHMGWFVFSRALQGLGGGLLVGLGFAMIRTALPRRHWARGMTAVSSMWGIGLLIGPALGGLFAGLGLWRGAYGLLTVAALFLALAAGRAFAGTKGSGRHQPLPIMPLLALIAAVVLISVAGVVDAGWPMGLLFGLGVVVLVGFFMVEKNARRTLLPRLTYQPGSTLKWAYLTIAALSAGVTLENFIPLYAQQMGGLSPFVSGLMAASISLGWTGTQFFFSTISPERAQRAIRRGPVLMTAGLVAYCLLQMAGAGWPIVAGWALALIVCGCGVGMAWPSLGVVAMSSSEEASDGARAAAAVSTTQLMSFSLASALMGMLMALGGDSAPLAARLAIAGLVVLAVGGVLTARRAGTVPARGGED